MDNNFTTINGFISPGSWDEDGHIDRLCLVTGQGKYFFLRTVDQNIDLFKYLKKSVVVEGTVTKNDGLTCMAVHKIEESSGPSD